MEEAELKIEQIEAVTFCEECQKEYPTVEHGKICPYCGSENTYLLRGNEFLIKEIEVSDWKISVLPIVNRFDRWYNTKDLKESQVLLITAARKHFLQFLVIHELSEEKNYASDYLW